jgi:hypothetical protein
MNEVACNEVIDEFLKVVLQCKTNKREIHIREPIANIHECKNMDRFLDNMRLGRVSVAITTPALEPGKKYLINYNVEKRSLILDEGRSLI